MEISLRHLESGESELTLVAQLADLKPFYDKTLSEVQKGAEIKGFRKGKAPKPMIEKLYRGQIEVKNKGCMKMYFVNSIKDRTIASMKF